MLELLACRTKEETGGTAKWGDDGASKDDGQTGGREA